MIIVDYPSGMFNVRVFKHLIQGVYFGAGTPASSRAASSSAVVYFRVVDLEKSVIQVENYCDATSELAQTTLRSVLKHGLDEMLSERATKYRHSGDPRSADRCLGYQSQ